MLKSTLITLRNIGMMVLCIWSVSCNKKSTNEFKKTPGIQDLTGVPAFADTLKKNTSFELMTKKFGILKFDLKHAEKFGFNGRKCFFNGLVSTADNSIYGKAIMFTGIGGIQIAIEMIDTVKHVSHRLQLRSYNGMHDNIQCLNIDGSKYYKPINSVSIIHEMFERNISQAYKDSIVLESGAQYELIDLGAFDKFWLKSNPDQKIKGCAEVNASIKSPSARNTARHSSMHIKYYIINGNPYGEFNYNDAVSSYADICDVIGGIDYNHKVNIWGTLHNISSTGLSWESDFEKFIYKWASVQRAYYRDTYANESNRVNILAFANGGSSLAGVAFVNEFGADNNHIIISKAPSMSNGHTSAHEASHSLGAIHDGTVRYPYCGWWYQDLMRDWVQSMAYAVGWHANSNNISAIRSRMQGY